MPNDTVPLNSGCFGSLAKKIFANHNLVIMDMFLPRFLYLLVGLSVTQQVAESMDFLND